MATDVGVVCKDSAELNVLVSTMLEIAIKHLKKEGITPLVVETYRSKERQYFLYGQGRTEVECCKAGMPKTAAKHYARSGSKVTWTLNSIHIQRCAVDVVPKRNGKAIWNSADPETILIVKYMSAVGFEAGANWVNSPDSPHFQVKGITGKFFTKKE